MNIPDHISENLVTVFGLKYLNSLKRIRDLGIFMTRDLGSGMEKFGSGIWDKHSGSATLRPIPDLPDSGSRVKKVPDPGSGSSTKNLSIFD
jgi:hypothetical protein